MHLVEFFLKKYKTIKKTYYNDKKKQLFINQYIDQIYVINLASNYIKRQYVKTIMEKLKINYTIVVVQPIHINVFRHLSELQKQKTMTQGEMGTYLSHMWCLKHAINNNYKKFIIFEDDIMFHKNFHELFEKTVTLHNYDFLMLGASHFKRNSDYYKIKDLVYKPSFSVLRGNLLGAFGILYSNSIAKEIFLLRKQNIVYFDYNLYEIFKKNIKTSAICYPNLVITDVSNSNLNHRYDLITGYYDDCYNKLLFENYHFMYLDIFDKFKLNNIHDFVNTKKALIYLLCNYFNNNIDIVKVHIKRLDYSLFNLKDILDFIELSKKKQIDEIVFNKHETFCKLLKVTPGYLLNNRKSQFRFLCLKYLPLLKKIPIKDFSPQSTLETVFIEFRILPHVEFLIRNMIFHLSEDWSHTIVCGNNNFKQITQICNSISNNIRIIKCDKHVKTRSDYSKLLIDKTFWEEFYGEKLLIYQEDSCIFKKNYKDFLKYDFIGAPWKVNINDIDYSNKQVGNGGFSLRTKKIMFDICNKFSLNIKNKETNQLIAKNKNYMDEFDFSNVPEDRYFSSIMIQKNIGKVAHWHEALDFSEERYFNHESFGGHQFWLSNVNWKTRMHELQYKFKIEINKNLNEKQKKIVSLTPYLFHKVILNKVDLNKTINYKIIKNHTLTKKIVSHLHCYDLNKFSYFFNDFVNKIQQKTDIIITYCIGNPKTIINVQKLKDCYTLIKINNKGMDIGAKFCFVDFLHKLNYKYSYALFLHSKTHDIIRNNWFSNIVNNLELIDINSNVGGYFPETIFSGDNSCLLWFDRVKACENKIKSSLFKRHHYNELYFNELIKYFNLNLHDITCFPEGNCYILKKEVAEKLFLDKNLYNILNTNKTFDFNWFKINYNVDCNDIVSNFKLKTQKNLCNNNLEFKSKTKDFPDCMIEHAFERIIFLIVKSMKLNIKILSKDKQVKNIEMLLNKVFDERQTFKKFDWREFLKKKETINKEIINKEKQKVNKKNKFILQTKLNVWNAFLKEKYNKINV